ncbi:MAG: LPS export ABC transporter permease LptF [Allorhizobium sp.]
MKLLEIYILRRVGQMFLTALLPVLAIIWTTQVLARINLVTDSGQSVGSFMKLATLILPTIIPVVMPFALVIGITQTLATMNNDSELAVIDAAGAPRSILIRPIILLTVGLTIFAFLMANFVEPKLRVAARQMIASAYADLLSTVIEEKTFRKIDDGLYVQISERLSGRILKGLFVADSRNPEYDLIYYAREGAVDATGTSLIMRDGEVHRKSPDGTVSVVRFDSYAFDLSDLTQSRGEARLHAQDRSLPFLLNPDKTDPDVIDNPGQYRGELNRRLSNWSFPLIFALISLVIAGDARSHRQARIHPMASTLILSLTIYWLTNYLANQTEGNIAFTPAVYAVPVTCASVAIFLLARRKQLRRPNSFRTFLAEQWRTIERRLRGKSGHLPNGGAK